MNERELDACLDQLRELYTPSEEERAGLDRRLSAGLSIPIATLSATSGAGISGATGGVGLGWPKWMSGSAAKWLATVTLIGASSGVYALSINREAGKRTASTQSSIHSASPFQAKEGTGELQQTASPTSRVELPPLRGQGEMPHDAAPTQAAPTQAGPGERQDEREGGPSILWKANSQRPSSIAPDDRSRVVEEQENPTHAEGIDGLAEIRLISAARNALYAGDLALTLSLLEQHRLEFSQGQLAPERGGLMILVHCIGGEQGATAEARAFLEKLPQSPLATQLAQRCLQD